MGGLTTSSSDQMTSNKLLKWYWTEAEVSNFIFYTKNGKFTELRRLNLLFDSKTFFLYNCNESLFQAIIDKSTSFLRLWSFHNNKMLKGLMQA